MQVKAYYRHTRVLWVSLLDGSSIRLPFSILTVCQSLSHFSLHFITYIGSQHHLDPTRRISKTMLEGQSLALERRPWGVDLSHMTSFTARRKCVFWEKRGPAINLWLTGQSSWWLMNINEVNIKYGNECVN